MILPDKPSLRPHNLGTQKDRILALSPSRKVANGHLNVMLQIPDLRESPAALIADVRPFFHVYAACVAFEVALPAEAASAHGAFQRFVLCRKS